MTRIFPILYNIPNQVAEINASGPSGTALHCGVETGSKELIMVLVADPRVDKASRDVTSMQLLMSFFIFKCTLKTIASSF